MSKKAIGRAVSAAIACVIIVAAGGGWTLLRRPVGVLYLVLFAVLCVVVGFGRQTGRPSAYDKPQFVALMVLGLVLGPLFLAGPPWEYVHFSGPIPRDGPLAWIGLAVFVGGIALQAAAMWALRGMYTLRLGIQRGHRVVTGGPYRLVRHPGYPSFFVVMMGIGLALSGLIGLGLGILFLPFLFWRIRREEEMLLAEFGDEYRAYTQHTRWRLIPLVYWRDFAVKILVAN